MSGINFDLPIWMLLLCMLGGIIYSLALYFRNSRFDEKGKVLRYLLAFLRFSLISILLSLLLNPFLKSLVTEVKEPIVAIVQDDSQSIAAWLGNERTAYVKSISDLREKLSDKFQVDNYALGATIRDINSDDSLSFQEELTNLSNLKSLISQYEGENLSAIILTSDGIFNQGKSPVYAGLPRHIPLYSVALGDTSKRRDVLIKNVYHNNIAYLNDITNIQVDIKADNCNGSLVKLQIDEENGGTFNRIKEIDVSIKEKEFFKTVEVELDLKKPGVAHYRVRIVGVSNEDIRENNVKDIFIEVLDARQKIRIIGNGPHPDIGALNTFLAENKNYEVEIEFMSDNPDVNTRADMVIFHNLPSAKYDIFPFIQNLNRSRSPRIFIAGSDTNLSGLNASQDMVTISGGGGSINEVQAIVNHEFSVFSLSDGLKNSIGNFPPLLAPFGEYKIGLSSKVLMKQKVGNIETDYPLIIYQNKGGIRSAIICAEGIWKWKLFDFLERENFDIVKELISKSVTYASLKEDKRKFRVSTPEKIYNENEDILFTAELYNDNYELVNESDVFFTVKNDLNEEFNYTFSKKDNYFVLDIGSLAPGKYSYTGKCTHNGSQLTDGGRFTVQEIQYELYDLEANHSLLHALSDRQNGKVFQWVDMDDLAAEFTESDNLKPVLYQYAQNKSVIDFKWLFYILLGFLGVEWFLRRYNGSV